MNVEITTINQISPELKKEIDIFIEKNKYSTIFHTTYWNNILIRNFADNNLSYFKRGVSFFNWLSFHNFYFRIF